MEDKGQSVEELQRLKLIQEISKMEVETAKTLEESMLVPLTAEKTRKEIKWYGSVQVATGAGALVASLVLIYKLFH
jgi:hypothetical protein